MKLLVGLGNPGPKYETTRHNAGFLMLDLIAEKSGIGWDSGTKFGGEVGKGTVLGQPCILLKPMTFMNRSGRSVGEAMRFFKLEPRELVVLHDELDVPAGKVKAREGGGHGGHNGIRSILEEGGIPPEFHRLKLGIGRPPQVGHETADWVLGQLPDAELLQLQEAMLADVMLRIKGIFEKG